MTVRQHSWEQHWVLRYSSCVRIFPRHGRFQMCDRTVPKTEGFSAICLLSVSYMWRGWGPLFWWQRILG